MKKSDSNKDVDEGFRQFIKEQIQEIELNLNHLKNSFSDKNTAKTFNAMHNLLKSCEDLELVLAEIEGIGEEYE